MIDSILLFAHEVPIISESTIRGIFLAALCAIEFRALGATSSSPAKLGSPRLHKVDPGTAPEVLSVTDTPITEPEVEFFLTYATDCVFCTTKAYALACSPMRIKA